MNNVVLIGRLTRDPELSAVGVDGKVVAKFTLAVDRRYKNSQGEIETDFIPIVLWNKMAETASQYLSKGRLVCVTGRLEVKSYEGEDGIRKYYTDVVADDFQFLDSRKVV